MAEEPPIKTLLGRVNSVINFILGCTVANSLVREEAARLGRRVALEKFSLTRFASWDNVLRRFLDLEEALKKAVATTKFGELLGRRAAACAWRRQRRGRRHR